MPVCVAIFQATTKEMNSNEQLIVAWIRFPFKSVFPYCRLLLTKQKFSYQERFCRYANADHTARLHPVCRQYSVRCRFVGNVPYGTVRYSTQLRIGRYASCIDGGPRLIHHALWIANKTQRFRLCSRTSRIFFYPLTN